MPPKVKPAKSVEAKINEEFTASVIMDFRMSEDHIIDNYYEGKTIPKCEHFDYADVYFNGELCSEGEPKITT
ncbi:MAG: hypothetical protein E7Z64_03300 [Thermoplasmata archaeon]|nr:hypothetical protein [Thermoplasmata archaeon]